MSPAHIFVNASSTTKQTNSHVRPNLKRLMRKPLSFGLVLLTSAILFGCGSSMPSDGTAPSGSLTGSFVDDAVEGLHYQTPTHSGITGSGGTFTYEEGEHITFYMGDVMLGQGQAQPIMTPIDLVPGAADETDQAVTNICRVLQTMDQDGDLDNGIHLPSEAVDMMTGMSMDFDMHPDDFDNQPMVMQFMADLQMLGPEYIDRNMVSAESAQAHLHDTMMDMMGSDMPMKTGVFVDSAVEGLYYETENHIGFTDAQGTFMYNEGDTVHFYLGDVMLGQMSAQDVITPLNLVPGATDIAHQAVTNMARLLQTLDHNNDPSDGITIPDTVDMAMQDLQINFDMSHDDFTLQSDVTMLMETLADHDSAYMDRMMVSPQSAQDHLQQTMDDMMGDGPMGDGPTDDGPMGDGPMGDGPTDDDTMDGSGSGSGMPGGGNSPGGGTNDGDHM